jgi:uncharacterized protein YbjT (DUF2867 family)
MKGDVMGESRILVTGATGGRQGSTGGRVARLLLDRSRPVRAFVHRLDARADWLRDAGAEVVAGDLLDYPSVRRALEGIGRAYFTYPVDDGLLDATAVFAAAARDAGLELVVNVSQLEPTPDAATPRLRQHWFSEQIFDWAGVNAVHLRAPPFFENVRALVAETIKRDGTIYLPWGEGEAVIPLVAGEDVARVAVGVLDGQRRQGQRLPFVGDLLTVDEMVASISKALERPVRYVNITDDQWRSAVQARLGRHALEHLSHLWQLFRTSGIKKGERAYRLTDTIEQIGGRPPQSLEQFVRQNADQFGGVRAAATPPVSPA